MPAAPSDAGFGEADQGRNPTRCVSRPPANKLPHAWACPQCDRFYDQVRVGGVYQLAQGSLRKRNRVSEATLLLRVRPPLSFSRRSQLNIFKAPCQFLLCMLIHASFMLGHTTFPHRYRIPVKHKPTAHELEIRLDTCTTLTHESCNG